MLLDFLVAPFDPARNIALFARLVEPLLPPAPRYDVELPAALEALAGWREEAPPLRFPSDAEVREAWPSLGPRARHLAVTHDADHLIRRCAQDAAGEYELGALLALQPDCGLDRLYGALVLATLPLGVLHAGPAPLLGALRGLARALE